MTREGFCARHPDPQRIESQSAKSYGEDMCLGEAPQRGMQCSVSGVQRAHLPGKPSEAPSAPHVGKKISLQMSVLRIEAIQAPQFNGNPQNTSVEAA